jgi:hypothetical protein
VRMRVRIDFLTLLSSAGQLTERIKIRERFAAEDVQRVYRGKRARRHARALQEHKALQGWGALSVQRWYRGYRGRKRATLMAKLQLADSIVALKLEVHAASRALDEPVKPTTSRSARSERCVS